MSGDRSGAALALSALLALAALSAQGCERRERAASPPDQIPGPASNEPIQVVRGARTISVGCERSCEPTLAELARLARQCVEDPLSTVRQVTESAELVALGCCMETESVYREACGDEGSMRPCLERWLARCERGELDPDPVRSP